MVSKRVNYAGHSLLNSTIHRTPVDRQGDRWSDAARAHVPRHQFSVDTKCRVLQVAPSGYDACLKQPTSSRAQEDARLLRLIRAAFTASQGIYGAPRVFLDLREAGETCRKHRVARLMRVNSLRALHGY